MAQNRSQAMPMTSLVQLGCMGHDTIREALMIAHSFGDVKEME